jgi:hypothetical protein
MIVVLSNSGWTAAVTADDFTDHGNFNRTGNSITLYSTKYNLQVGTASYTSNNAGTVTLISQSPYAGTWNFTKS